MGQHIFKGGAGRISALTFGFSLLLFQCFVPAQAQPAPASQKQAITPASAELLQFKDFFKFPVASRGLEISPQLQQAAGKPVRLIGYMVKQENGSQPGQFLLTPRPVQMSEHSDGDADDLPPATVLVKLAPEQSTWLVPHARGLIELQGTLSVGRQEASDGRVTWVQLQLNPEATKGMTAAEMSNYLHSQQHRH
jgi:hypothetical protein